MRVFLELPYPPSALNPNAGGHFMAKARKIKSYRQSVCFLGKTVAPVTSFGVILMPPDKRRRDVQNAIAAMKAGIDGLQDAWGIDDSKFRILWPTDFADPIKGGAVLLYHMEGANG